MERKVSSYDEYNKMLKGRGDIFVFRGQLNSSFVLIPSGLRPEHINNADKQMFEFVKEIKTIFGFDELTCIEIAQHFSLPTRMLDFSYSFDVALFFACYDPKEKYKDFDGKVYIFNKTRYEKILKEKNKKSSEVIRNNQYLYNWLRKYLDRKQNGVIKNDVDLPIFVDATRQFDRLSQQKGLFLLWGSDERCLEKIMEDEQVDIIDFIDTITIKKEAKDKILQELVEKHISQDTLYMNMNLIRDLVKKIKG